MTIQLPTNLRHNSPIVAEMDELRFLRTAERQELAKKRRACLDDIDAKYQPELDRLQKLRDQEIHIQEKVLNPYSMGYLNLSDDDKVKVIKQIDKIRSQIYVNINHEKS